MPCCAMLVLELVSQLQWSRLSRAKRTPTSGREGGLQGLGGQELSLCELNCSGA